MLHYCIIGCIQNPINRSDWHLCLQHLALIILKLGMITVAESNRSSKMNVMKLLIFGLHKILFFFALCEKELFLTSKKSCIINGASEGQKRKEAERKRKLTRPRDRFLRTCKKTQQYASS